MQKHCEAGSRQQKCALNLDSWGCILVLFNLLRELGDLYSSFSFSFLSSANNESPLSHSDHFKITRESVRESLPRTSHIAQT